MSTVKSCSLCTLGIVLLLGPFRLKRRFIARSMIPFLICCFFFCVWSCLATAVLDDEGGSGGGILGGGNRAGPAGNLGGPAILGGPGIRGGKPGSGNPGPGGVGGIAGRNGGPYLSNVYLTVLFLQASFPRIVLCLFYFLHNIYYIILIILYNTLVLRGAEYMIVTAIT